MAKYEVIYVQCRNSYSLVPNFILLHLSVEWTSLAKTKAINITFHAQRELTQIHQQKKTK